MTLLTPEELRALRRAEYTALLPEHKAKAARVRLLQEQLYATDREFHTRPWYRRLPWHWVSYQEQRARLRRDIVGAGEALLDSAEMLRYFRGAS